MLGAGRWVRFKCILADRTGDVQYRSPLPPGLCKTPQLMAPPVCRAMLAYVSRRVEQPIHTYSVVGCEETRARMTSLLLVHLTEKGAEGLSPSTGLIRDP